MKSKIKKMRIQNLTEEQKLKLEEQDLQKASKRSRRVHIAFGIGALVLLGLVAISWFTFGGLAFLWAINLTLSISAIGCLLGSGISWLVNRKNRAKMRAFEESRKQTEKTSKRGRALSADALAKNERRHTKHWLKDQRYLTEHQKKYIESRTKTSEKKPDEKKDEKKVDEGNKSEEKKEEKKTGEKAKLNFSEVYNSINNLKLNDDVIEKNYKLRPVNAEISEVSLFNKEGQFTSIKDLPETKNDVSYNLSLLHIMDIVNQANSDLAKVKIVQKVNGEENVLERNIDGDKTFTEAEMKGVKEKIDSKKVKVDERDLGL